MAKRVKKTTKSKKQTTTSSVVKKTTQSGINDKKATLAASNDSAKNKPSSKLRRFFLRLLSVPIKAFCNYQARRPHRSFQHTPSKLNHRPLKIEGYFKFSQFVLKSIWRERRFFGMLLISALIAGVLMAGITSQTTYSALKTALDQTYQGDSGVGDQFFKSTLLLISTASGGGFNPVDSEGKQLMTAFLFMVMWLVVVWYLRNRLAGHKVKFRDALYRSCSPMIASILVSLYMVLQMVPMLIFLILYSAAVTTGFASEGVEMMILQASLILVVSLTIYWLEGSFLAMVIVTINGTYPMEAIRFAGDLVIGRRLKILKRLLWHLLQVAGMWLVIGLPVVFGYDALSSRVDFVKHLPIVPLAVTILTLCSVIWSFAYVYFLYRRIIEDESQPA